MDGGDCRRIAQRSVRAHDRGHRRRLRDHDSLAGGGGTLYTVERSGSGASDDSPVVSSESLNMIGPSISLSAIVAIASALNGAPKRGFARSIDDAMPSA